MLFTSGSFKRNCFVTFSTEMEHLKIFEIGLNLISKLIEYEIILKTLVKRFIIKHDLML